MNLTIAEINANIEFNQPPTILRCGLNGTRTCCKESDTPHPASQ